MSDELDPNKGAVAIGMGLALGAGVGVALGTVIGATTSNLAFWIAMGPSIGAGMGLCAAIIYATYQRRPGQQECPHCGYSTKGLRSSVCPECGGELNGSDAS